ncbi:hypothetical protein Pint_27485 [Pistacia integerrima]|uniref:Uncharacterized protein n=1 Tax=Pistacia integerrima TaxID=434235 RepID=A0ACC0YRX8_9ROSI|nr:hypothetical protein Pint_27485 [Pistacia integerrima]
MIGEVSKEEIQKTMFGMSKDKAPGPDGNRAFFFKKAWDIVGHDVFKAIQNFFKSGKMLREVNCAIIALVPKNENPSSCSEFRPISCCNTIYKCISKIMANRVKRVLPQFISKAQGAFMGGRKIVDNILLSQELLHHYDRKSAKGARCAIKVDLMKAYDSVRWDFIIKALEVLGFPLNFIGWVEECIKTLKYSIAVNGELTRFFSGSRGLRQGDPISPYLFVIAMEVLSRLLNRAIEEPSFKHHWRCKELNLTHLYFADDLMIFCHADENTLGIVKRALDRFTFWVGLEANPSKSNIFFSGVSEESKQALLSILGYQEGKLPMKYLGVPLITKKLSLTDCKPLVDKILALL